MLLFASDCGFGEEIAAYSLPQPPSAKVGVLIYFNSETKNIRHSFPNFQTLRKCSSHIFNVFSLLENAKNNYGGDYKRWLWEHFYICMLYTTKLKIKNKKIINFLFIYLAMHKILKKQQHFHANFRF